MSERDFDQKLEMRRAFWALGASTRIDVKLSALVPTKQTRNRAGAEEWTDLDVLAVQYAPIAGLISAVADCKTTRGAATERVFWLRGVADLFGARAAYMTRDEALPPSTRQLALRLGISAMDRADRAEFVKQAGDAALPTTGGFLGRESLQKWMHLTAEGPRTAERLQRYRRAIYWLLPRHKNLTQLPLYLAEARSALDPSSGWAQAVVVDCAWLYLSSVLFAVDELTRLHLAEPTSNLRQVVVGSEPEIREREALRQQIRSLLEHVLPDAADRPAEPDIVPSFFGDLVDLVARATALRGMATEALRVLEFTGVESMAAKGPSWTDAAPRLEPLAVKLASDTVRFLVRAASLDVALLERFDQATGLVESKTDLAIAEPDLFSPLGDSSQSVAELQSSAPVDGGSPG